MKQYTVKFIKNGEKMEKHYCNLTYAKADAREYQGEVIERVFSPEVRAWQTRKDAEKGMVNVDIIHSDGTKEILSNLSSPEAKEICYEYKDNGYKLYSNMLAYLWEMTKEEKIAAAENLRK